MFRTHGNLTRVSKNALIAYLSVSVTIFVLMMGVGVLMRLAQARWLSLPPDLFYQAMTAHGAGLVGAVGLAASAVLWYFLRKYVALSAAVLLLNLALFLIGAILVLGGIFLGGFGGGWTFLFPLPSHGLGMWGPVGAASYLAGLLAIGTGFLLLYLDVARAILAKYGNFGKSLGWPQLFRGSDQEAPPATVVAATMVLIVNIAGIAAGAIVLALILLNLFLPAFQLDPLLAKNLTYFFGHVFINATIYQAVVAVYEILPEYAKRPWKVSRVFLAAWTASTLMVMIVYPHHLLMDFVMPTWMLVMGQVISYASGLPVLVVTVYGAMMLVHRSGIRWDMASGLLFLSMFGWAAGVIPAVIDGTIMVNSVMHNTMWVPGHFHMYLILGLVAMLFGFMYYATRAHPDARVSKMDGVGFWLFAGGGFGFCLTFLVSGSASVPRRWAVHYPEWLPHDQLASVFGAAVLAGIVVFLSSLIARLGRVDPE